MFYEKTQKLLDLALWMQNTENGVSITEIMQKFNVHHMHKDCVSLVNAHSQAVILQKIQDKLDETEAEIIRRGRNAHAKHSAPRNQDPDEYAASTGFEALFGYLYLTGQHDRISRLVSTIEEVSENG